MIACPARLLAALLVASAAHSVSAVASPLQGRGNDVLAPICTTTQRAPGRVDGESRDDRAADTGIDTIVLSNGSSNLVLTVDSFDQGAPVATWTVGRLNSLLPGSGGVTVTDVAGNEVDCAVELAPEGDCNGNGVADSIDLSTFTSYDWNGNSIPDECEQLGIIYCSPQSHNSTGQPAFLLVSGSNLAADNDVTLSARNMPVQSFGYFAVSRSAAFIPAGMSNSTGNLCLGSPRGGYRGTVMRTGMTGSIEMPVDLASGIPFPTEPNGTLAVTPGTTVYFQTWFRDNSALFGRNNLSDAVEVLFQ